MEITEETPRTRRYEEQDEQARPAQRRRMAEARSGVGASLSELILVPLPFHDSLRILCAFVSFVVRPVHYLRSSAFIGGSILSRTPSYSARFFLLTARARPGITMDTARRQAALH